MLVPVPLEVLSMLQMFRGYSEQKRSPLLEMLLPHFEEIFDEIDEESVSEMGSLLGNSNFSVEQQAKCLPLLIGPSS